jgi:crotonobetainyl-CoA:carnitine CoA-transferase CaiB-like acyl-CoA transferase
MSERVKLPSHKPRPSGVETALGSLRIIDFTHFIAGPLATMLLGDMGADVIKVEKISGGDDFRAFGAQINGVGAPFIWCNRNKRSVALDLTRPEGQEVARQLISTADVVVENFSAGVMQRFGLDYEAVKTDNPRLVYCAVSAYGRTGPFASRLGFDPIVQAESGYMSLNGFSDRDPLRSGPAIMDMSTAIMASNAILGALMARERLNKGQYVEVSLYDTGVLMAGFHAMQYLTTGNVPSRQGNGSLDSGPTDVFQAADGPFYLACANDRTFHRLAIDVLERPDLAEHPDFAKASQRVPNQAALSEILRPIFASYDRATLLEKMRAAGVPAGDVRTLDQVFQSPEMLARERVSIIPFGPGGTVPNIAPPLEFAETPIVDPTAAPVLGQDTVEVLSSLLHYDQEKLGELTDAGIIGDGRHTSIESRS